MLTKPFKNKKGGLNEIVIMIVMLVIALMLLIMMFWGTSGRGGIKPATEGLIESAAERINEMNDIISGKQ